jgi:glycine cleavage system H protein
MYPKEYRYTGEHEWICLEDGERGKVGITEYAASQLGDIIYLDLPGSGTNVEQSQKMGEIESVKAVSDLFPPVDGQVIEVNQTAIDDPKLVNDDPYGAGWLLMIKLSNISEMDALLSSDQYDKLINRLAGEG